jgi:hypothetical protein
MLGHFNSEMRKRFGHDTSSERVHEETQPTSMKRDESHVMDINSSYSGQNDRSF